MRKPFLQPQKPSYDSRSKLSDDRQILSVSQVNRKAKSLLEQEISTIWIEGELSNFIKANSGHWYFSLKDQSAQIKCALFKFKNARLDFIPQEGDKVVVKGKVSLYEARGDYQLIADYMEPSGLGDLQRQLNEKVIKLAALGLFDKENKKPLPKYPKTIGVITSPSGAAVHDVLTVLKRRSPMTPIVIYPTQVQGKQATKQIIETIEIAEQRNECDVLLITRGGGSLEDLWCFNDESLAKKIADCHIPIIAAIGHEVDVTVTELVADLRAATPSAAAELLSQEQTILFQHIDHLTNKLSNLLTDKIMRRQQTLQLSQLKLKVPQQILQEYRHRLKVTEQFLFHSVRNLSDDKNKTLVEIENRLLKQSPKIKLLNNKQSLHHTRERLIERANSKVLQLQNRLANLANQLDLLSPLSTLSRGYAIVKEPQSNKLLNKVEQFKDKQAIRILVSDGSINAKVSKK